MKRILFLPLIVTFFAAFAFSFGTKEEPEEGKPVVVIGVLRLVGNEPFTRLVVSDSEGRDYLLQDVDFRALGPYLGNRIRIKGILKKNPIRTADGRLLSDELSLSRVEIEPIQGSQKN